MILARDRVTSHALDVVHNGYPSGHLHYLACSRHLDDLKRENTDDFPYYWDESSAQHIITYAEELYVSEGTSKKKVTLIDEQAFFIGSLFGWKKVGTGYRRFRRSYYSVARQNGKSFLNGIIGSYISAFSGYDHGKLFTVATSKRQSRIAWEEMKKFIEADSELNELFSVQDYKSFIRCKHTKCTIEALSKEAGLSDGFRAIFASVDELHEHKDNGIYKAIYNGTRSLPETLVSMISTRGKNVNSFAKEMDDYAVNILKRIVIAEDMFVDIFSLDDEDDYFNPKVWFKANPFFSKSEERMDTMASDAQTAKDMGSTDLVDFIVKSLNRWVNNADNQFIDVDAWTKQGSNKKLDYFVGQKVYVGLDLSSGGDLTTLNLEIPYIDESGTQRFYWYSHSFMPRGRLVEHLKTDLAPYDMWEERGFITVTGGDSTFKNDYGFIINHLREIIEDYELTPLAIGIDPHNADGVIGDLEEFGCPVVIINQSARNLNDATVDIRLSVKSMVMDYDIENELLSWSMSNAKIVANSFGEIKVDKEPRARHKRIDPVDAGINAHTLFMKDMAETPVDHNAEMSNYLELMGWN